MEIENSAIGLVDVGMGDEGPGLQVVARGQAAGIAGAETGQIFGARGAEVPFLRVLKMGWW